MKQYLLLLFLLPFVAACDKDEVRNNNPYLPSYNFSIDINMDLPLYTPLQFTANPVVITQAGIGINGIIVMNTGSGYVAYEDSCPNQELSSCSRLTVDGINAVCPCDNTPYNLFTGDGGLKYRLRVYRVEVLGPKVIRVYN